jgi:hypothetical protein
MKSRTKKRLTQKSPCEDWRRIATRHDKRARNFETAVAIAASSLCRT